MKTEIIEQDEVMEGGVTYTINFAKSDLMDIKLTRFDQALLKDIETGKPNGTPLADMLLGLELMMRRIEESKPPKEAITKLSKGDEDA